MQFETFDTQRFILEIKRRPAIWNASCDDTFKKQQQWDEIVRLYGDESLSPGNRKLLCDNLKKKWRNIRDCFKKAHKARLLGSSSKNTKYCFYNLLTFLTENDMGIYNAQNIENQNVESQNVENCQGNCFRNESDEGASSEDSTPAVPCREEDVETDPLVWPAKRFKQIKNEHFNADSWLTLNPTINNEEKRSVTKHRHENKKKNIYEEDDDRLFFLSLVKEFKKVPEHAQIQAKLDILQVLQKAQVVGTSNGTTTLEDVIRLNDIRD